MCYGGKAISVCLECRQKSQHNSVIKALTLFSSITSCVVSTYIGSTPNDSFLIGKMGIRAPHFVRPEEESAGFSGPVPTLCRTALQVLSTH